MNYFVSTGELITFFVFYFTSFSFSFDQQFMINTVLNVVKCVIFALHATQWLTFAVFPISAGPTSFVTVYFHPTSIFISQDKKG